MSEMILVTPEAKRLVNDYDVVFDSGIVMPLTVDSFLGDTIEFEGATIKVKLVAKPSFNDPSKTLPAEDITVYLSHVVSIQHRERELVEQSPAQKAEWAKVFQEMTHPTVQ